MTNNKFSLAFIVDADGQYHEQIQIGEGCDMVAANIIFSMMNGQFASLMSLYLKKHYPNKHEEIMGYVSDMYAQYLAGLEEENKSFADRPVVKPTEVFGGK
jgi:hypothetical protein